MKKLLCLLLAALMIAAIFTGCAVEPGPLRICVDLSFGGLIEAGIDKMFYDIFGVLQSYEKIGEYEVEYIPAEGPERETALDRIRTEIMSGKGPDVFILSCIREDFVNAHQEALFPSPEKAMESDLFLPLDEYIENNAAYGEWDQFTEKILDAGKNKEGQQIIPIAYTLPIIVYRAEDVDTDIMNGKTWDEILADEALYKLMAPLADGERPHYNVFDETGSRSTDSRGIDTNINYILGDLADFKEEELLFSEEELQQRVREICEMKDFVEENEIYDTTGWYEEYLGDDFYRCYFAEKNGIYPETDEISIFPLRSQDGGVTATVTSFAAVNRNTRRPEEAFAVIDRLLYFGIMQESWIYSDYFFCYGDNDSAIPLHTGLFTEEFSRSGGANGIKWSNTHRFPPQIQKEFFKVLDDISHVEFADSLHMELENMMLAVMQTKSEEEREKVVSEHYAVLKRIMAE